MKSNQQFINEIYQKYDEYTKEKREDKQRNMRKIVNMAAVVIVLISSLIVFSGKESQKQTPNYHTDQAMQANIELETVGNFENFYQIIKEKSESNRLYDLRENVTNDVAKEEMATESTSYKTNTQVENVDEADIVKVDEKYIYYVADQRLIIIDAQNAESSNKVAEINYKEEKFNPIEIYVKNNKLIVIGSETGDYTTTCKTVIEDVARDVARPANFKTGMILYDISNIKDPKEIRRVMLQGSYISSRMIENDIYFVANQYLYTSPIIRNEIKDLDENYYKPKYEDTAISQDEKCIEYNKIYCLEGTNDTSYLVLAGLNTENNEEADIKTFLGAGQYVYSSEKNMYIAVNREIYGEGYEVLEGTTHILKFALEDGKITYKAGTDIEGQVNNQFSMDENGEYFRIATTSGRLWNMDKSTSNNLYVLNDKLEETGKISGFAQEEKIYSVRYVGNKAYVVTFKQTDPLFVIDLSNPSKPQILGELKLPGYSTYLHPYDETHIIGFGYETKENGTRVTTEGLKMVMFDISDFTNPQVLFKVAIGDSRYTYSELLYNHKALLFSKEKNIIAFPLYSSTGMKSNSRAAIYEIDLEKGFSLKGEIGNITNEYLKQVERIVFVNDTYYTLSKSLVKVANMETLEVMKEIEI